MLVAQGGRFGGYSLYIKNGKLVLPLQFLNASRYTIASDVDVPLGKSQLRYEFAFAGDGNGGGTGKLFINDRQVGEGRIGRTRRGVLSHRRDVQRRQDLATPVSEDYQSPFKLHR